MKGYVIDEETLVFLLLWFGVLFGLLGNIFNYIYFLVVGGLLCLLGFVIYIFRE